MIPCHKDSVHRNNEANKGAHDAREELENGSMSGIQPIGQQVDSHMPLFPEHPGRYQKGHENHAITADFRQPNQGSVEEKSRHHSDADRHHHKDDDQTPAYGQDVDDYPVNTGNFLDFLHRSRLTQGVHRQDETYEKQAFPHLPCHDPLLIRR
jgi:hypothetical protein